PPMGEVPSCVGRRTAGASPIVGRGGQIPLRGPPMGGLRGLAKGLGGLRKGLGGLRVPRERLYEPGSAVASWTRKAKSAEGSTRLSINARPCGDLSPRYCQPKITL